MPRLIIARVFFGVILLFGLGILAYSQGQDESTEVRIDLVSDEQQPTIVKTGELFAFVLRIRYLDLSSENKEIMFDTGEITQESMAGNFGSIFRIHDFQLSDPIRASDIEIWRELRITLSVLPDLNFEEAYPRYETEDEKLQMLIKALGNIIKTTTLKIDPIPFRWGIVDVGEVAGDRLDQISYSPSIYLNHVFTTHDDPNIQMRDGFKVQYNLVNANIFKIYLPLIAFLIFMASLVFAVQTLREKTKPIIGIISGNIDEEFTIESYIPDYRKLSFKQLRNKLWDSLESFRGAVAGDELREEDSRSYLIKVYDCIDNVVRNAFWKIPPGDSPEKMKRFVQINVKNRVHRNIYCSLIDSLIELYPFKNNVAEPLKNQESRELVREIKKAARKLWVRHRIWANISFKVASLWEWAFRRI